MNNEIANLENVKAVLLSINVSYENMLNKKYPVARKTLLDCVQKYWKIDPERANTADFVFGIYKNEIKAVAKITKPWKRVFEYIREGYFKEDDELKENPSYYDRYAFIGELIKDSTLLGKKLSVQDTLHFEKKYKNC